MRDENDEIITPIAKLVPTAFTLLALFLSLSAIRFALNERWMFAVSFIVIAAVFDGVDGRIARFLNASSPLGAQLDSLADFVNFGVVPPLIVYFWKGHELSIKGFGWGVVLLFASCMAIRLARFNVMSTVEDKHDPLTQYFFTGVPAPMGAGLVLLPMIFSFQFGMNHFWVNPLFIAIYTMICALLLVSTLPTISIKKFKINKGSVNLFLAFLSILVIGLIVEPWFIFSLMGVIYIATMPIVFLAYLKIKKTRIKTEKKAGK
jgi:CDP-diacylglycerol--serine O-phosphatidyltransferase